MSLYIALMSLFLTLKVRTESFSTLHKKMKFSIMDFFSKCDQIRSFLRIWSHLLKKSLMEKFIFCAVPVGDIVLRVSDKDIIFICFLILPSNKFRVVLCPLS